MNDKWVEERAVALHEELMTLPMKCDPEVGNLTETMHATFATALQEAFERGKAEQSVERERLLDRIDSYTGLRERGAWPQDVRDAIEKIETEHDIEMVSIEHHATWVDMCEAAEAKLARLADPDEALVEASEVITRAAARFRDYEKMHQIKGTAEAAEKAENNAWHAEQLEAWLAKHGSGA